MDEEPETVASRAARRASAVESSQEPPAAPKLRLVRQRAPGRRRLSGEVSADMVSAATREDIVRVATTEFARVGFAAASVSAIAARTRTSKRMLYYHFGSKEQLYVAVLEAAYARVRRVDPVPDISSMDPMVALREYAEAAFANFAGHPEFVRLLLFENLSGAKVLRRSKSITAISADNLKSLEAIVRSGQASGAFRKDIRPLDLFLTVVGMSFHAIANRETVQATMGVDMLSDEEARYRRALVGDLVCRYAAAAGPGQPLR